jgi:hypothetical protein
MTDKEIFERFMLWIGMKPTIHEKIGKRTLVLYKDINNCDVRFTKRGYDDFKAGAVYDKNERIVKAYLDSHVVHSSDNSVGIFKILSNIK